MVEVEGTKIGGLPFEKCRGCGVLEKVIEAESNVGLPGRRPTSVDVSGCFTAGGVRSGPVGAVWSSGGDRLLRVVLTACVACFENKEGGSEKIGLPKGVAMKVRGGFSVEILAG